MTTTDQARQFEYVIQTFPEEARRHVRAIPANHGKLTAAQSKTIMEIMGIEEEALMVLLLPLARLYSIAPISKFRVGAVAKASADPAGSECDLYLGANIEFTSQALSHTVHAEQAATLNAWQQGAVKLHSIAVPTAPCGYCRQFLYELEGRDALMIVTPGQGPCRFRSTRLVELLPEAFGPLDLKKTAGLMSASNVGYRLTLKADVKDPVILEALSAADRSYAPYTNSAAGCAIQESDERIYRGPYVENAAFNPSLSPLQTAISSMNMGGLAQGRRVSRAVLVEKPAASGQRAVTELLLRSFAPDVSLEYFEAT
jgi:cytidine deaminase